MMRPARRHKHKGNVQFILRKAGEAGYFEDFWIDFNQFLWKDFVVGE